MYLHRDWAHPGHVCRGTVPHLRRDWARRCHICTGTALYVRDRFVRAIRLCRVALRRSDMAPSSPLLLQCDVRPQDYTQANVCRCIMVYAIFSCFAYIVNLLLAIRFLGVSRAITLFLMRCSLVSLGAARPCFAA